MRNCYRTGEERKDKLRFDDEELDEEGSNEGRKTKGRTDGEKLLKRVKSRGSDRDEILKTR
jgi:hypothetical protein